MSIQQLSPNSIVANPAHVNPQARADQTTASPQVNQNAQRSVQALKTDTVTISKQALQMLANDSDSAAKETRENSAEKAAERATERAAERATERAAEKTAEKARRKA